MFYKMVITISKVALYSLQFLKTENGVIATRDLCCAYYSCLDKDSCGININIFVRV